MNVDTIEAMLNIQDFRPFRIVMNNGRKVDIRHPEFAMLTTQGDLFVFRASSESETLPQAIDAIIAVKNICQIEPLTAAAA